MTGHPVDEAGPVLDALDALDAAEITYMITGSSVKHVRDVRGMLAAMHDQIDRPLLARLVARLGVRAQWDEVVGDARGPRG